VGRKIVWNGSIRVLEYRYCRPTGPAEFCTVFAEQSLSRLSVLLCHANVMHDSKEKHFNQRLRTALSNGSTRLGVFLARKRKQSRLAKRSAALKLLALGKVSIEKNVSVILIMSHSITD